MALVGQIFLRWLLEEYFPLHAEFVEQPQPLCDHRLGRWHSAVAYYEWARWMMRCLLLGGVPRDRRLEVRLQLQRAGRLFTTVWLIDSRDIGRISRSMQRPIIAPSHNNVAYAQFGESRRYVNLVRSCLDFMEKGTVPMSQEQIWAYFLQQGGMMDQVQRRMDSSLCDFECYQSDSDD